MKLLNIEIFSMKYVDLQSQYDS